MLLLSFLAVSDDTRSFVAVLFVLVIPLAFLGYLRLSRMRVEQRWKAVAIALGLRFDGGNPRSIRGEVDGVRVDAVWRRQSGILRGGQSRSSMQSGTRLQVRYADLGRDLAIRGASRLDEVRARPELAGFLTDARLKALELLFTHVPDAEVDDTGIRVGGVPEAWSVRQLAGALAAMIEAGRALGADASRS